MMNSKNFKIFTLNSNEPLAKEIANQLEVPLGKCSVKRFSDGEVQINIEESVRGNEVFLVQATSAPANEHFMELLIMIDAMKRASAQTINVLMPYYGYARQDRKMRSREPITAKLIANLLETTGTHRLVTLDLHAPQIQGFFSIPVDMLQGIHILAEYIERKQLEDVVVVAPNNPGVGRARKMANQLDVPIAFIDKRKSEEDGKEVIHIVGNIEGKTAVIIDDLIDTAETVTVTANLLMERGSKEVYACCVHPVFSGNAIQKLEESIIKEIVVTNSIHLPEEKRIDKLTILSVAPLLADALKRIYERQSVSVLVD